MEVGFVSDLHLDFYTDNPTVDKLIKFYQNTFYGASGHTLVIAGDISHSNHQAANFCRACLEYFDDVVLVTGNHDLYNTSKTMKHKHTTLFSRPTELQALLADEPHIHFLDGNYVDINGVRFAGTMGWYDCSYYYKLSQGLYSETMLGHWMSYTNDARLIPELNNPLDLWDIERAKIITALETKPQVMVTHFCPITHPVAIAPRFATDRGTGYYCFDSAPLTTEHSPEFWIHGHMHDRHSFQQDGTQHLRNPLGYPSERTGTKIQFFNIKDQQCHH